MRQRRRTDSCIAATIALVVIAVASCRPPKVLSIQRDPGTVGNGVEQQAGPYSPPPEVTQRLNNAPEGKLSAPAMFWSKTFNVKFKYRVYVPAQYKEGTGNAKVYAR